MKIENFVKQQKEQLDLFLKSWVDNNKLAEKAFPLNMGKADWCEQYTLFDDALEAGDDGTMKY